MSNDDKQVVWGPCCFCGQQIAETDTDPCSVTVETATKHWQTWFCHAECFRSRITKESRWIYPPHISDPSTSSSLTTRSSEQRLAVGVSFDFTSCVASLCR